MSSTRQLAAIMFTDIVGYTALMGDDEQKAFQLLQKSRQLQVRLVDQNNGRWIKELGDGALTSFSTASDAVRCAVSIQQECSSIPNLKLHIGIHLGEVMFENGDVFGEGVNIASRLQALASVGEILISESVYLNIRNKKEFVIEFYREETLKNVASQVKLYRVKTSSMAIEDANGYSTIRQKGTGLKQKNIAVFLFVFFVFLIAAIVYFNDSDKGNAQETAPINIEKSIAVLPFENMSNDQQQEFFANGMTDEILNHLFKIGGWRIVSRTSTMAYKGSKKTTKEIANDLNVDHLLEGSVQKEGNRVRIRIRLINGKTDEQLWGDNYEIDYKEVFAIQSEIAQKVAAQLNVKIDPGVKERILSLPTQSTEAYTLYLRAKNISGPDYSLLEKAIAMDPNFADAYAELAWYWLLEGTWTGTLTRDQVLQKAEPLLQKAMQLNPDLASAHSYNSALQLWFHWDFNAVQKDYETLLQLYPSNPETLLFFNDFLLAVGKSDEALRNAIHIFNTNKNGYRSIWSSLALAYHFNRQPENALKTIKETTTLFPDDQYAKVESIRINVYNQQYKEVIQLFDEISPTTEYKYSQTNLANVAIAYHQTGQRNKAAEFITELKQQSEARAVGSPSFYLASVYAALGDLELAIQLLEKSYSDHEIEMYWLKVHPTFESLHGDKRFQDLVRKLNYPKQHL